MDVVVVNRRRPKQVGHTALSEAIKWVSATRWTTTLLALSTKTRRDVYDVYSVKIRARGDEADDDERQRVKAAREEVG